MRKNKKILRVFVERTSMTPNDEMVRVGMPDFPGMMPDVDEVHISVLFTWQMERAEKLKTEYRMYYKNVRIGGVPYGSPCDRFKNGMYLRKGIIITTRGCDFKCPWCNVPKNEGRFREINIEEGNIIQDNNILLSSRKHLNKVREMLSRQSGIILKGIDCRLLKSWHIDIFRSLRIKEIWLALDSDSRIKSFQKACLMLTNRGFPRDTLRCYVLAGLNEPIKKSEGRLRFAYECGTLPFVQVYQKPAKNKRYAGELDRDDNLFVRKWSRPGIIKAMMKK